MAPESYWKLSESEKYEITNGCGPQRATNLIPNTIFGINLKPACDIHDYTYAKPNSVRDRLDADDLFMVNMKRLMDQQLKRLPFRIAGFYGIIFYYLAVRIFGNQYFGS